MPDVSANSISAKLMTLVDVDHLSDFEDVVTFLSEHLDAVIAEVHGLDKLLLDNGKTQLNCPPAAEKGDSHGAELIRTLSEQEGPDGVTLKREFKVHDLGVVDGQLHSIEIREDIVGGADGYKENVRVIRIARNQK